MSGLDLFKTLESINIDSRGRTPESFNWLFCENDTRDLLIYFCNYINSDNVLTDEEVEEYESLKINGRILENEDLEEAISKLDNEYCNIIEVDECDLKLLERELFYKEYYLKNLSKFKETQNECEFELNTLITEVKKNINDESIKYEQLSQDCLTLSQELENIHDNLHSQIEELFMSINSNGFQEECNSNVRFLSQMPIESYNRQRDNLYTFLNMYIQKEFQKDNPEIFSSDILAKFLRTYKSGFFETIKDNILCKFELSYNEEILKMYEGVAPPLDEFAEHNVICLEQEIADLESEGIKLVDELQKVVNDVTEKKVQQFILEQKEKKFQRYKNIIYKLKDVNKILTESENEARILIYLLESEIEHIEKMSDFLISFMKNDLSKKESSVLRMEAIEKVKHVFELQNEKEMEHPALKYLTQLFTNTNAANVSFTNSFRVIEKFNSDIKKKENELFFIDYKSKSSVVKSIEQQIKLVIKYLWNGPTKKPVFVDIVLYKGLHDTKSAYYQYLDVFTLKITKFTEIKKKLENRWSKCKHCLWIWFLTEPKKVIRAITEIDNFIQQKCKNQLMETNQSYSIS